jgi:hypothetical protein
MKDDNGPMRTVMLFSKTLSKYDDLETFHLNETFSAFTRNENKQIGHETKFFLHLLEQKEKLRILLD